MSIKCMPAVVFVRDIAASRRFYEGLLGQKVLMDHGPNVAFSGLAIWEVGHATRTIFGRSADDSSPLGRDNFEVYFETAELAALRAKLGEASVEVIHELKEEPWGQRTLRVRDPDGHIVEFGEPMPAVIRRFVGQGLTYEQIAQRTAMPVEVVRHMAEEE